MHSSSEPDCTTTEYGWRLEISDLGRRGIVGAITFALILQKNRLRLSYTCAHTSGAFALNFGVTLARIFSQLFLDHLLVFDNLSTVLEHRSSGFPT